MIRTKRAINKEKGEKLYKQFIEVIKSNTITETKEILKITEYMYYKMFNRWISELKQNKFVEKARKEKRQNIPDGYHPWVSKILRVS